MAPAPTLTELVDAIRSDAQSSDPLEQLVAASEMVATITDVSDAALGFFVDQCRHSGKSWSEISAALGVSKQAAHKRFNATGLSTDLFTDRAHASVFAATREAQALGHNYVGTEHLLLGLFDPKGGIAARVLVASGVPRDAVVDRITSQIPRSPGGSTATPSFTPRATKALTKATTEALGLGHNYVGTEHILLALIAEADGLAAQVLSELGLDYDNARARAINELSGFRG